MRKRTILILAALLWWSNTAAANDKLVAAIKTLGKAVDDMTVNMSKAKTDEDAQLLAKVTRQALDNGLKQDKPVIAIAATAGHCKVTIGTPQWTLWSEAQDGKIIDHGAKIY